MRTKDDFVKQIKSLRSLAEKHRDPIYGGNVIPMIRLYEGLVDPEERKAFRDGLEEMLCDDSAESRSLAVDLCLGFIVFRDVPK